MFKNYLTIAFRKFKRNKFYSLINILGLGIGISASLVIYLIVQHEFSYEKSWKNGDQIYRVVTDLTFPGNTQFKNSGVPLPLPAALRTDLSGIDAVTQFITAGEAKVAIPVTGSSSPIVFKKQADMVYADEYYFSLFNYTWLAGSSQVALTDPFKVVLFASRAKTYFGNLLPADIIGKQMVYDDTVTVTVSGVVADITNTATDFRFKEFISMATVMQTGLKNHFGGDSWGSITSNSQSFVKLSKGTSRALIEKQLPALRLKYTKKNEEAGNSTVHHLQPLRDIHFNPDYDAFDGRQAHRPTLYGLFAVAIFLLLLGCINFVNLTTAQSALRAKEIGIRKTAGSSKRQLILQFLCETFVLTTMATALSILLAPWLLNIFKDFIPPEVNFFSINQPHVYLFLVLLIVVMTFLSGFYPAWVLTRFQPVEVLKNQLYSGRSRSSKAWLRKCLTVMQFVIAQFLIIATLVVSKQIHYSLNKDLGFKKDAIVIVNTPWDFYSGKKDNRRFVFLEKLKAMPGIEKVTLAGSSPASNSTSSTTMKLDNGKKSEDMMVEVKSGDATYFDLYKIKLLAGRFPETSDTTREYVINETYAKTAGFDRPQDAVGHLVERSGRSLPVVGVIADFHTKSTRDKIKPLAFSSEAQESHTVHLSLMPRGNDPDGWKNTLGKVERSFKELFPEGEYKFKFFDESVANFYKTEQNISRLLTWSAGLCIFISCLGLLGLVMYITNTRTKEIGVRKVLGASVLQIVSLLSKDFLSLVLIAFVAALPLAWCAMHDWLQDFAYRTALSWWIFAITGAGMIVMALAVLSVRTIRSATDNPVKSLRTE